MKKAAIRIQTSKPNVVKVDHTKTMLRTNIPAGMATPHPPLGSMLGQRHINVQNFCSTFNDQTKNIHKGIPIPTRVKVLPDNKFEIFMSTPPSSYLLKQAAGLQKGKYPGEGIAGKITVKHLYEIAQVKSKDHMLTLMSLQQICQMLLKTCNVCGIQVVHSLNPTEYGEFLKERNQRYIEYMETLKQSKEAKLQRLKSM